MHTYISHVVGSVKVYYLTSLSPISVSKSSAELPTDVNVMMTLKIAHGNPWSCERLFGDCFFAGRYYLTALVWQFLSQITWFTVYWHSGALEGKLKTNQYNDSDTGYGVQEQRSQKNGYHTRPRYHNASNTAIYKVGRERHIHMCDIPNNV